MGRRFTDITNSLRLAKCAVALLVSMGVLFAGSPFVRAQTADAPEKPKTGMALPGEKCRVPPLKEWTEPEGWAWVEICEGRFANFNGQRRAKKLNPENPKPEVLDPRNREHDERWAGGRKLGSHFLETILLHEPFRSAIPHQGIIIYGAYFKDRIDLSHISIKRPLEIENSLFQLPVIIHYFTTPMFVSFKGSRFDDWLDADSVSIGRGLFMQRAEFQKVSLVEAKIGGRLDMSSSVFKGTLDMDSASIGSDLFMGEKAEFKAVDLRGAKIGGRLAMSGSRFKGELFMEAASIGSDLFMRNAQFDQPTSLAFLRVGFYLDLRGTVLRSLDLTGARIERDLWLGLFVDGKNIEWKGYEDETGKSHNPKLTLKNATVGALQDTEAAWPDNLKLEFDGFTYKRFESGEKKTLYERGSGWFVDWLAKDKTYSPQPYLHLASVLRVAGHDDKADDILYASRARKHRESDMSWRRWAFLWVLWLVIGYGYGWLKFLALIWVGVLVILGTFILRIAGERDKILSGFLNSAFYSLDMLLPVIRLRERHYKDVDLSTWARYYFYFHQIMGYVLIFFVIAGLSGLTK